MGLRSVGQTFALVAGSAALLAWALHRKRAIPLRLQRAAWRLQQRILRRRLIVQDLVTGADIRRVGGVDISFIKGSETDACAALVVLDATTHRILYSACKRII